MPPYYCPEPDVLHEFEKDTEDIPKLEVNMEAITETGSLNVTVWPLSVTQMKKLETVHHKFQRRLLGIS